MFERAGRIANLALSETFPQSETLAKLRAQGQDELSLGTGEPDAPTPPHVCDAAYTAMRKGDTRYPPTAGTVQLHQAIATHAHGNQEPECVSMYRRKVGDRKCLCSDLERGQ